MAAQGRLLAGTSAPPLLGALRPCVLALAPRASDASAFDLSRLSTDEGMRVEGGNGQARFTGVEASRGVLHDNKKARTVLGWSPSIASFQEYCRLVGQGLREP